MKTKQTPQQKFDKQCLFEDWVKVAEPIKRTHTIKNIIAWGFIGFGTLTLPLPTGSVFLIALGLGMLGISKYRLTQKLRKSYKLLLYKYKAKRLRK